MFKPAEFQALNYSELPLLAGYIYTGVFLFYVDHRTQLAQVSDAHIRDLLTKQVKPGSKKAPYVPTRQEIRWAIQQLIAEGLLKVKKPGTKSKQAPVYLLPLTYKKLTTTATATQEGTQKPVITGDTGRIDTVGTAIGTTKEQPRNSHWQQPQEQPQETQVTQGIQASEQPQEQPHKNGEEPHLYYNTNKTICISTEIQKIFTTPKTPEITPFSRFKKTDVINYFLNSGSEQTLANEFFDHYDSVNWNRPGSGPIMKFEPVANKWIRNNALNTMKKPTRTTNHVKPNATQNLMEMAILHRQKQGGSH
jgi:hypothetical protein